MNFDLARDDAADDAADASVDAAAPATYTFVATVAECINPTTPDPAACRAANANDELTIDTVDGVTGQPFHAMLRFDIDGKLEGRAVVALKLRLVSSDNALAAGPSTGEVWRVDPFTLASLSTTTPQQLAKLADVQGAVSPSMEILWPLSVAVASVSANTPAFLGLYPTDSDGTNYWNLEGVDPPALIVSVE